MPKKLTLPEIQDALKKLEGWTLEADMLTWRRTLGSFSEAFALTTQVALLAERRDHHPDIALSYDRLRASRCATSSSRGR